MIPLRTSFSLRLRVIPPSAGLSRATRHKPLSRVAIGYHLQPKSYLTVVPDLELEEEIARLKGVK